MEMNFLTVGEFAKKLKMHPGSVRRCIQEGRIFATKLTRGTKAHYRIPESELERLYLQGMCEPHKKGA